MPRHKSADVAQSVERRLGKAEVTGSIPVISFFDSLIFNQGFFFAPRGCGQMQEKSLFSYEQVKKSSFL